MYIYVGKLNWFNYAENECVTIVFPASFAINDPVCAHWQWTVDSTGREKSNNSLSGLITSVRKMVDRHHMRIPFGYYTFEGTVSTDFSSLSLTMSNPQNATAPVSLSLQFSDAVRIPSTSVFTGKLNWSQYSQNEMVTLVIPGEVADGEPVVLNYQWTKDSKGGCKTNETLCSTMHAVNIASNGDMSATFKGEYYTYDFTANNTGSNTLALRMTNPSGARDAKAPYYLMQTDFRNLHKKKALLIRFGTGVDKGMFLVQEMLVKHLGFASADVELVYFDVDPVTGTRMCTKGQDPPTASNFKSKLSQLCHSAVSGDVRFLYVDVHSTTARGDDEVDGKDGGWVFAGDGVSTEIVSHDWIAQTIRQNIVKGVNLTILTTSCTGGDMLNTKTATPGIMLTACHETQVNSKAFRGMDPWTVGLTSVIKNNVRLKRGVPTYSVLYNNAKSFVREQLVKGELAAKYKGPSPHEWCPVPTDQKTLWSNQDPQLVFWSRYIDPGEERFLFPFGAPGGGDAAGDLTIYPQDEYPRDDI